jgi:hypothetical protein
MARDDRQRRRGEGRRATSQHRRLTHWRPWHHGLSESLAWLAAAGRVDSARLAEQVEDWPTAGDAVMVTVPPGGHDGRDVERQRAPSGTSRGRR